MKRRYGLFNYGHVYRMFMCYSRVIKPFYNRENILVGDNFETMSAAYTFFKFVTVKPFHMPLRS